jgi:hypothetical protein
MRRLTDAELIRSFMRALHRHADVAARVYFTGGATAVLLGWRPTTIDIDVRWEPDHDDLFRALPRIKEDLQVNVELAWPFDFIPELPGWRDRCLFVAAEGRLQFFHCDPYAQALAKIERGHAQDRKDVATMLGTGLVERDELRRQFEAIQPQLHRYPAVDPRSFRRALDEALEAAG